MIEIATIFAPITTNSDIPRSLRYLSCRSGTADVNVSDVTAEQEVGLQNFRSAPLCVPFHLAVASKSALS